MSVHLVVDHTLKTSDFGVQLIEYLTEEKDKLNGTQVCFSRVTHDKSLEWFKLDDVMENISSSDLGHRCHLHLLCFYPSRTAIHRRGILQSPSDI